MERPVPKIQTREMCVKRIRSTGFVPDVSPAGYVPDRAGDEKPSLKVSSGSRERKRFTPSGFREHRPEILKDISGYVDDCYY